MPRPVNVSGLQNAFAQVGQSNARLANLELQQRERERAERAQLAGIAGGVAGGAIGGPAGAQIGGALAARAAGGAPSQGALGASIGGALAQQQAQSAQQEQQQASLAQLQQARQEAGTAQQIETGELVQPAFFQGFQPAQARTPEQIAQAQQLQPAPGQVQQEQPPMLALAQPQLPQQQQGAPGLQATEIDIMPDTGRPSIFQPIVQARSVDAVEAPGVQPQQVVQPQAQPTQQQVQQAQQEQALAAGLSSQPAFQGQQLPFDQRQGLFGQLIQQQRNQLAVEEGALRDPRLSPQAFQLQQARVDQLRGQLGQAERQFAGLREQRKTALAKQGITQTPVSRQYSDFLTKVSQSTGRPGEIDKFSKELKALKDQGLVSDKDFREQSKVLRNTKISGIKDIRDRAFALKKDFNSNDEVKTAGKAITAYKTIEKLVNSGKATGPQDLAIIVKYLKTIDPPSVARESEVAAVSGAVSVLERAKKFIARGKEGRLATDKLNRQILAAAKVINEAALDKRKRFIDEFAESGYTNGVPTRNIFGPTAITSAFDLGPLSTKGRAQFREDSKLLGQVGPDGQRITMEDLNAFYQDAQGSR